MNIFLGGVHGVGKSFLANQVPASYGYLRTSASSLIKEERLHPNWGVDKRVEGAAENQILLAEGVKRKNNEGIRLFLDGHFVLKGVQGDFIYLGVDVFSTLNLKAAILLEAEPHIIARRVLERDGRTEGVESLREFIEAEHMQAQQVCNALDIPLAILNSPTLEEFLRMIERLERGAHI
ncbi:ATP-binding protein [Achromobacter xylosoxidans]|uniref:ATP-binding protein n=1 Tax=Alcaligenes xylosoxydans xylosoxydans TaxID=85698 RepID=UPI001F13F69A|nr:ATP-binding protein [Achromobacter xylosoxidans]